MIEVLPVSHSNPALLIFLILLASVIAFAQTSLHLKSKKIGVNPLYQFGG